MRTLLMLALLVVSCSPPPPPSTRCDRFTVDSFGTLANGFAGGFGGGGFAGGFGGGSGRVLGPSFPVAGDVATLRMFAPLTTCPGDDVRSSVEVTGPDNLPVPATLTLPQSSTSNPEVVSSQVTFTTTLPGTYVVRAIFEPSLGVRTATQVVIATNLSRGVQVPLSGLTCQRPWPLTAGTVACELSNATIAVLSADAGHVNYPGTELVVAGDVLWSRRGAVLERAVWSDTTGVARTHTFPNFTTTTVRGEHTRHSAIRNLNNGNFVEASIDGGLWEFQWPALEAQQSLMVRDGDDLRAFSFGTCGSPCVPGVVAFEPDVLWRRDPFTGEAVGGYARPYTTFVANGPPRARIDFPVRVEALPAGGFERWPLWIDAEDGSSVLVSTRGSATEWTSWPRARVLNVGAEFAVLTGPGSDSVLVVPIWP